jgi:signal transduction histidine kinase
MGTVWHELILLRTNLNKVIQSYSDKARPDLDRRGIQLQCELPDDPVFVLGYEPDVYLIASNLIDNSVRRGFDESDAYKSKIVSVIVQEDPTIERVTLFVRDNGKGLPQDWQFGVGLTAVSATCRRFCADWTPPSSTRAPFTTEVKVQFYKVAAND